MNYNILIVILVLLCVVASASAAMIPTDNWDFKNKYNITNIKMITSDSANVSMLNISTDKICNSTACFTLSMLNATGSGGGSNDTYLVNTNAWTTPNKQANITALSVVNMNSTVINTTNTTSGVYKMASGGCIRSNSTWRVIIEGTCGI